MKKTVTMLMLIFIAFNLFAQTERFGRGDIWIFNPNGVKVNGDVVSVFFDLDIENSYWNAYDPIEEGLYAVTIKFEFFKNNPNGLGFSIGYLSKYNLVLPNFIVVSDQDDDSFLLGGMSSLGDRTSGNPDGDVFFSSITIYPNPMWMKWFLNDASGDYIFGVFEFNYGDNLWYNIPEEMFEKLREIYRKYNGDYNLKESKFTENLI